VVPEDYYRVLKENKEIERGLKGSNKHVSGVYKSKFESGFESI
jgi:hypothetical protein